MPSRRRLLRLGSAALVGLAGCIGRETARTGTDTPTPTAPPPRTGGPTPTTRERAFGETGPNGIIPVDATVQSAVRHLQNTDHNGIMAGEEWYLFVAVEPEGGGPEPADFRLRTPSKLHEPFAVENDRRRQQIAYVNGDAYEPNRPGWLLFTVPYDERPERAWLTLDRTEWPLPESATERLRAEPPAFDLRRVEVPESPPHDEPFDVTLRVGNDGGSGTFRAAFNYTAPLYYPRGVRADIEAGATRDVPVTVDIHTSGPGSESGDTVAANVVSAGGDDEWSVTLS